MTPPHDFPGGPDWPERLARGFAENTRKGGRRPGHGQRRHGGPPWMRDDFAGGPPWMAGAQGRGSRRRGRGDVRLAVLGLLASEPMHGYQLIREIQNRSDGAWRASPGSVYPTLSALEDEGLVQASEAEGRRSFSLTDAGRAEYTERSDEFDALWTHDDDTSNEYLRDFIGLVGAVGAAAMQVAAAGNDTQREQAADLLEQTRRNLYRLLAGDDTQT
ncbi:MAG: PadR family transcriptional regulator [Nocardioidaceae bacterium]